MQWELGLGVGSCRLASSLSVSGLSALGFGFERDRVPNPESRVPNPESRISKSYGIGGGGGIQNAGRGLIDGIALRNS